MYPGIHESTSPNLQAPKCQYTGTNRIPTPSAGSCQSASTSIEQPIEVPPEPEYLEALAVTPAPTELTMTDWQQEFAFNHQESVLDPWDCEVDEIGQ